MLEVIPGASDGRRLPAGIYVLTAHLQNRELSKYVDVCLKGAALIDKEFNAIRTRTGSCVGGDINFSAWKQSYQFR
jgi:hypothetical protein